MQKKLPDKQKIKKVEVSLMASLTNRRGGDQVVVKSVTKRRMHASAAILEKYTLARRRGWCELRGAGGRSWRRLTRGGDSFGPDICE